jgi:gamma-glutamyltranspeptidase/glutathione hydrolase
VYGTHGTNRSLSFIAVAVTALAAFVTASVLSIAVAANEAYAERGTKFREAVRGESGVITSESPVASEVGLSVLDSGGNAVDAAVATTFALNAARPQSCGVGGGGFMVYRGADGETATLNFREEAPAAIEADTFAGDGLYTTFTGRTTVGVPGTVAGMDAALESYGTIGLSEALAPAESLAREGVEVQPSVSEAIADNVERIKLSSAAADQFLVDGEQPYEEGSTLIQPELAETFSLISEGGPEAFYEGQIAEEIVREMEKPSDLPGNEGLITREDLANYEAVWREPLVGEYRGREVVAMPPPTSGGIATLQMLNILEGYDLASAGLSSADALHLIAEAQKIAFADREEYVADTDAVEVPVDELVSKDYADQRRKDIDPEEAGSYEPGDLGPAGEKQKAGSDTNPDTNTTNLSVIDAEGNSVALTCTIEQSFGSGVVAPGTGFLLNNELTDFSEPGTANEPAPGKRPRSSINPVIVAEDGEPRLVVGGAGGVQIVMGSLLAVTNVVDFGLGVDEAIDAERIDEQTEEEMLLEDGRVSPVAQAELIKRGHVITKEGEYMDLPRVQAAGTDLETGERVAVTDPRSGEEEYAALAQEGQGGVGAATQSGLSVEDMPDTRGLPLWVAAFTLAVGVAAGLGGVAGLFILRRRKSG